MTAHANMLAFVKISQTQIRIFANQLHLLTMIQCILCNVKCEVMSPETIIPLRFASQLSMFPFKVVVQFLKKFHFA